MKNSIRQAYQIAFEAHRFKFDLSGEAYINHPLAVCDMVKSKKAKIVALLHDVIEDSDYTRADLERYFTEDICNAVEALTRKKGENYFKYIESLKHNELAKTVKIADLKHNMDVSRLKEIHDCDIKRLKKYLCAYHILQAS
jgi:(p)ppGpp synthase/HD superfamily hydrolase